MEYQFGLNFVTFTKISNITWADYCFTTGRQKLHRNSLQPTPERDKFIKASHSDGLGFSLPFEARRWRRVKWTESQGAFRPDTDLAGRIVRVFSALHKTAGSLWDKEPTAYEHSIRDTSVERGAGPTHRLEFCVHTGK